MWWASVRSEAGREFVIAMTVMPAARAPWTPARESSMTQQCLGGTSISLAVWRKISGRGFSAPTSWALTTAWK